LVKPAILHVQIHGEDNNMFDVISLNLDWPVHLSIVNISC